MKNSFLKLSNRFFTDKITRKLSKHSDSILSPLKNLATKLEHRDVVYVTQQSTRWTAKELDAHSDAFAYYLVEQEMSGGNKILFWSDINHSSEYISASIGAIKAGNTIVSTEYENWEDVQKVLKESEADILVVSPFVKAEKNKTRMDKINESIPELCKVKYGDIFKSQSFTNLKQIIQISHKTIPGTEKFKHCMNYTKSYLTNLSLPGKSEKVFEFYTDEGVKSITHKECLERINEFNQDIKTEYANIVNSSPIFYPVNLTLGFMGGLANRSYSVIPGNYNFVDMLKLIDTQRSPVFICEDNIMDIQLATDKVKDVRSITSIVEHVVMFTNRHNLKNKNLDSFKHIFQNAKFHFYDEHNFKKLD